MRIVCRAVILPQTRTRPGAFVLQSSKLYLEIRATCALRPRSLKSPSFRLPPPELKLAYGESTTLRPRPRRGTAALAATITTISIKGVDPRRLVRGVHVDSPSIPRGNGAIAPWCSRTPLPPTAPTVALHTVRFGVSICSLTSFDDYQPSPMPNPHLNYNPCRYPYP